MRDVSIVVPTVNRSGELNELLQTIRAQTLVNFEALIVDDGSTPEHLINYKETLDRLDDSRFRFIEFDKADTTIWRGPGGARNRGILSARAPFIAFCDDDDRWLRTDHLAVGLRAMKRHDADVFFADIQVRQPEGISMAHHYEFLEKTLDNSLERDEKIYDLDLQNIARHLSHRVIHSNTLMIRRAILDENCRYWEPLRYAEDKNFAVRVCAKARRILYRDELCGEYIRGPELSLATSLPSQDRLMFAYLGALHAELETTAPLLRAVARGSRAGNMVKLAETLAGRGDTAQARRLALEALLVRPTRAAISVLWGTMTTRKRRGD